MAVIEVQSLAKAYGSQQAVADVSFAVEAGEIFGILGPNGAGKTTTVECMVGLRRRDAGSVRVLGVDPQQDRGTVRRNVGVQLQEAELPERLTVAEALRLYASFYDEPADWRELLDLLGLSAKAGTRFGKLSGGQQQRLSIALALVGNPRVAVLDELTTGLDPAARQDTWQLIEQVRDRGVTIVLVTHFMAEAERLCDRLAVIDAGRVVAMDTPAGIVSSVDSGQRMRFRPSRDFDPRLLTDLPAVTSLDSRGDELVLSGGEDLVTAVTATLARHGIVAGPPARRPGVPRRRVRRPHPPPPGGVMTTLALAPGSTRRGFRPLLRTEAVLFLRSAGSVLWTAILPLVALVVIGNIHAIRQPAKELHGISYLDAYLPILMIFSLCMATVNLLPPTLAAYREKGILRRTLDDARSSEPAARRAGDALPGAGRRGVRGDAGDRDGGVRGSRTAPDPRLRRRTAAHGGRRPRASACSSRRSRPPARRPTPCRPPPSSR